VDKSLSGRARRRLALAAGLLSAPRASGGLGLKVQAAAGEDIAVVVLRAIGQLPAAVAADFRSMVDWVEAMEGGGPAEIQNPLAHPVLRDRPRPLEVDPFVENELDTREDEAVLQAMASVQGFDQAEEGVARSGRSRMRG